MMMMMVVVMMIVMMIMTMVYPKRAGFDSTPAKMKPMAATMNRKTPSTISEMGRHCKVQIFFVKMKTTN